MNTAEVLTQDEIEAFDLDAIESVDVKAELQKQASTWPDRAAAVKITDQASFDTAGEMLLGIKDLRKAIKDTFDPIIEQAHKAHKIACDAKKTAEAPLETAEKILKPLIAAWLDEQERIRRDAEQAAMAAARKREEEERIKRAMSAAESGADAETITEVLDAPVPMVVPSVAPTFAPVAGISGRKSWKWKITNENLIPRTYLCVDEKAINAVVKGMQGKTVIPGIEVYQETSIAAGRR
jgi:Fe-S-cluster formation regulator IscX/YfhJ